MTEKATIIIITYNALKFIRACLTSIKKFTPPIYKIIIIDNNSNEKTKKYLKTLKKQDKIKVIFNKKNRGYGAANNQAVKYVDTKYICLLNSDTVVSPDWLENLIEPFEKQSDLAITIPVSNCTSAIDFKTKNKIFPKWEHQKILLKKYSILDSLDKFYGNYLSYTRNYSNKNERKKYLDFPGWAGTWCVVFKKDILEKVGGLFDEQFKIGYCEDVDFSWRVYLSGYKIAEIQNSFVHHYSNASFDVSKFDKNQLGIENKIKLLKKYQKTLENYIEKQTRGDKFELAFLADEQSMIKSYVKYVIMKRRKII